MFQNKFGKCLKKSSNSDVKNNITYTCELNQQLFLYFYFEIYTKNELGLYIIYIVTLVNNYFFLF